MQNISDKVNGMIHVHWAKPDFPSRRWSLAATCLAGPCDEKTSFAILDAFVDHGFDAIDTADVYSRWADGNQGGESETMIGRWLQARRGCVIRSKSSPKWAPI
jgi:aryl-alcohol dehydrogenase-like predicted oxidoreductase